MALSKERLETRVEPDVKSLIQKAADLQGRSLSDFVIETTLKEAQKVIKDYEVLTLNQHQSQSFVQTLLEDTSPNPKLQKAAQIYKKKYNHSI